MLALPVHSFPLRPRNEAAWRLLSLRVDSRFRTGGPKVASSNLAAPTLMAIHGTVSSALTVAGAIAVAAWWRLRRSTTCGRSSSAEYVSRATRDQSAPPVPDSRELWMADVDRDVRPRIDPQGRRAAG